MNILALTSGIILSIVLILFFKKNRLESSKYTYSLLLFSLPFYYFVFAIYGKDYTAMLLELLGGGIFFIIVLWALKLNNLYKFVLLASGYILHGVYDVIHNLFFINTGTPAWWSEFCGVIDIVIGLYLVTLAFKYRVSSA